MQEIEEKGLEKAGSTPEKGAQDEPKESAVEGAKGGDITAENGEAVKQGQADDVPSTAEEGKEGAANEGEEGAIPAAHSDEWYRKDSAAFDQEYPALDKDALFADEDFLAYAEGKVGEVPLADVYRGYLRLKKSLTEKARAQAARNNASGSLRQAASDGDNEYYTLGEMQAMSAKYIEQHWDKVQKSLKRLK